jgi:hydrogenase/urease accessory protein HupE
LKEPNMKVLLVVLAALVAMPGIAEAHGPAHDHGSFAIEVSHLLASWDHLLPLVAAGIWAPLFAGLAVGRRSARFVCGLGGAAAIASLILFTL